VSHTADDDSDFSEPSTPSYSDSDDEMSNPALVERVPRFCWLPPSIPSGRFVWNCPGCDYFIDFLDLHDEDLEPLPENLRQHMASKEWQSIKDIEVQDAFSLMVDRHYALHMHQRGVQLVKRGKKVSRPSLRQDNTCNWFQWFVVPYESPAPSEDNGAASSSVNDPI